MAVAMEDSKLGADGGQKRPLTPFFFFKAEEAERGHKLTGKEAGKLWQALPEEDKQPYIERHKKAKEAHDKYLLQVEGYSPKRVGKPTGIQRGRVRALCGRVKDLCRIEVEHYKGLAKVLVLLHSRPCRRAFRKTSGRP